jgi:hypothetical protein
MVAFFFLSGKRLPFYNRFGNDFTIGLETMTEEPEPICHVTPKDTLDASLKLDVANLEHNEKNLRIVCSGLIFVSTGLSVLKERREEMVVWLRNYHVKEMERLDQKFKAGESLNTAQEHEPLIISRVRDILYDVRPGVAASTRRSWAVRMLKSIYGVEKYSELTKHDAIPYFQSAEENPRKKLVYAESASGGNDLSPPVVDGHDSDSLRPVVGDGPYARANGALDAEGDVGVSLDAFDEGSVLLNSA